MQTIPKNTIRKIVAYLVDGCEVEVVTLPIKSVDKKNQQLIDFACTDRITKKSIPVWFYIKENGKLLSIDSFHDKNGNIDLVPDCFKIILPPGCHLALEFLPCSS